MLLMVKLLLSCVLTIALIETAAAAPLMEAEAEEVGPLIPESKRRDTTLETLELEQSLKRLSGENKKFFPNPYKQPIIQVDGLMHEGAGANAVHDDADEQNIKAEEELEKQASENETGDEDDEDDEDQQTDEEHSDDSSEEGSEEDGEQGNAKTAEDMVSGEEAEGSEDQDEAEQEGDNSSSVTEAHEDEGDEEDEQEKRASELSEDEARLLELRSNNPEDEDEEFLQAILDLLERHPEVANLLLQVEEQDENQVNPGDYYQRNNKGMENFYGGPLYPGGIRPERLSAGRAAGERELQAIARSRELPQFYQPVHGDRSAHVVAKKMKESAQLPGLQYTR